MTSPSRACANISSVLPYTGNFHDVMFYITAVPLPPAKRLTVADVFDAKGKPRPDVLKQHFVLEGRLSDECALRIINDGTALLRAEKTMIDIEAPVTGRILAKLLRSMRNHLISPDIGDFRPMVSVV